MAEWPRASESESEAVVVAEGEGVSFLRKIFVVSGEGEVGRERRRHTGKGGFKSERVGGADEVKPKDL